MPARMPRLGCLGSDAGVRRRRRSGWACHRPPTPPPLASPAGDARDHLTCISPASHLQATPVIISTPKPLLALVRHLGGTDRLHSRRALRNGAELTKLAAALQARRLRPRPRVRLVGRDLGPMLLPRDVGEMQGRYRGDLGEMVAWHAAISTARFRSAPVAHGRRWCSTRRTCSCSRASSLPLGCRAARATRRAAERRCREFCIVYPS